MKSDTYDQPLNTIEQYMDIGRQFIHRQDWDNAISVLCQVLELQPDYANAYTHLGWVLLSMKQYDKAEAFLLKSIEIEPTAPAFNNLGLVYDAIRRLDDAEICFREAIRLEPNSPQIHNNLGTLLDSQYRMTEAETAYREALRLDPQYAGAHYNLGNLLPLQKKFAEAEQHLQIARKLRPTVYQSNFSLAFLYLLQGKIEQGCSEYSKVEAFSVRTKTSHLRRWCGEDLRGRSILLHYANGLGDTINFIRFVASVAKDAERIAVWVQQPLAALVAASYPQFYIYAGNCLPAGDYDYACILPNLPILYRYSKETIPQTVPYLHSLPEVSAMWFQKLALLLPANHYRVGIAWACNPKHNNSRHRSIPFSLFSVLLNPHMTDWVSLQVGERAGDAAQAAGLVLDISDALTDFSQTAAVIENLDLVITVDTSVAHLAGAMGKKTWILLPADCDWRWQLDRTDTLWYPNVRLFRQQTPGDWQEVLERVGRELEAESKHGCR